MFLSQNATFPKPFPAWCDIGFSVMLQQISPQWLRALVLCVDVLQSMPLTWGFINNAAESAFCISFSCMSCVVLHCLPHQAPWLCCAPALFSPRWHSVFEARLPLAPGLFGAHRGFDSPAAPSNSLPWWTARVVTMEGQRSVASHCVPSHYCYDCWEEKKQVSWPGCSSMREIIYQRIRD